MRNLSRGATCLVIVLSVAMPCIAENFPAFADLPSRPEMPDPLVMLDGSIITNKADWFSKRRPELKGLFEHYMYGKAPAAPEKLNATIDREDKNALGGKATLKEIRLVYGPPETPNIHLILLVPNAVKKPVPVFLGLGFAPIFTVIDDPKIAEPVGKEPTAASKKVMWRGSQAGIWNAEAILDRGYALAVFYSGDVAPDRPGRTDGVFPSYPGFDWGVIAAWAWGLSRAADYLVTDPEIDRTRIAVVGHSRNGKAALLAGAFDDRFALVFSHQAGCGGSAPSRGTVGESVKRINTVFPHWFNDEFKRFNEHTDKLPIDQNCLVAMVAPRPVLFTCAVDDTWSNPDGQFQVLKAAEPIYKLLNAGGLDTSQVPETGKLVDSTLGYAIRPGKHSMNRLDWTFFLDFADKQFGRSAPK